MTLVRTQINLEEAQYRMLQFEAQRQKRSLSDIVRESINYLNKRKTAKKKSLLTLASLDRSIKIKTTTESVAEHHDDYLYGKYSKKWGYLWKDSPK